MAEPDCKELDSLEKQISDQEKPEYAEVTKDLETMEKKRQHERRIKMDWEESAMDLMKKVMGVE